MLTVFARWIAFGGCATLLQVGSCVDVVNPPGGNNGGGNPSTDSITVRFVNETPAALDPQFFASSQPLGDPELTLFLAENQVYSGIGFAGRGTMEPATTDEIDLSCDDAKAIGTRGGYFVDAGNGEFRGNGQQRYLAINQAYNCGSTVTFYFRQSGSTYTTSVLAE